MQIQVEYLLNTPTPYRPMWERQKLLQQQLIAGQRPPIIICTEHESVYTLGRHGHEENLLRTLPDGIECVRIDRGGDITWHGPGQLVVYPIVSLHELRLGVKQYVDILEQAVIDLLADYGIAADRVEGATGVWLGAGTPRERKICAIGVKVSRGVTMHGLDLSVCGDLQAFTAINPCGFSDKGVTTLQRELQAIGAPDSSQVSLASVAPLLMKKLIPLLTAHC